MHNFYVSIYSERDEDDTHFVAQYAYPTHRKLKFDTILNGGYGSCSFDLILPETLCDYVYDTYIEYHVVVEDAQGTRLYEGAIVSLAKSYGGIKVKAAGYFGHGRYVYLNLLFTLPTVTDVIQACVDLCPWWDDNTAGVDDTTDVIVDKLNYSEDEIKVSDLVSEMLKFGSDVGANDIRGLYFAVWGDQTAWLTTEPNLREIAPTGSTFSWFVFNKDLSSTGTSFEFSSKDVVNKVRASYELSEEDAEPDQEYGPAETGWFEDEFSQDVYGVREGTVDVGKANEVEAENIAQLAINKMAFPAQTEKVNIDGFIYTPEMCQKPAYLMRAGDIIEAADMDLILTESGGDVQFSPISINRGMVMKTTYTVESNKMTVLIGDRVSGFERVMARNAFTAAGVE